MELHHVFQYGRLGEGPADERLDGLLHPFEGKHLRHQQIEHVGLDAGAVLLRAGQILRERPLRLGLALGALLDFGVDVLKRLLEDDVDAGAALVPQGSGIAQVFPAALAGGGGGDRHGLDGAGIRGAWRIRLRPFALGPGSGGRLFLLGGLRRGQAGVAGGFGGVFLHERRHHHLDERQQGLEQGAALRPHLALGAQVLELPLQGIELFAHGGLIDGGHRSSP